MHRVREAAEKAKIELSGLAATARSACPSSPRTASGPKHMETTLTRAKFERTDPSTWWRPPMGPLQQAHGGFAGLTPGADIAKVLLAWAALPRASPPCRRR